MDLMLRRTTIIGENASIQLPPGYRRVTAVGKTALGSTKCQVNTGYTPYSESKISVDYRFIGEVSGADQIIGSAGNGSGQHGAIIFLMGLRWSIGWLSTSAPAAGTRHSQTAWFDGTYAHMIQDGVEYSYEPSPRDQWFMSSTYPMYLLGRNQVGNMYNYSPACMVYSMKIWTGNVLVRNFVPCIRESDNRAGFYDLAGSISSQTGTSFYTNMAGTSPLAWEA